MPKKAIFSEDGTEKKCAECEEFKPLSLFSKSTLRGKTYHHSYCAPCLSAKQQIRAHKRYEVIVKAKSKPCMDCGNSYPACAMQFDHRDPATKNFGIGSYRGGLDTILKEIEKCDVVCANCHAIRTHKCGDLNAN